MGVIGGGRSCCFLWVRATAPSPNPLHAHAPFNRVLCTVFAPPPCRNVSVKDIHRGHVASDAKNDPCFDTESFEAQVIVMNHKNIQNGYAPVLDCHTAHVACKFETIKNKLDRRTNKVIEDLPKSVKTGDGCDVIMKPMRPLVVESFKAYPPLGRFAVRDMRMTVAVGVINSTVRKVSSAVWLLVRVRLRPPFCCTCVLFPSAYPLCVFLPPLRLRTRAGGGEEGCQEVRALAHARAHGCACAFSPQLSPSGRLTRGLCVLNGGGACMSRCHCKLALERCIA